MTSAFSFANRVKRSLQFRARSAKCLIVNAGKFTRRTSFLARKKLLDAARACSTKAELLRGSNDALWCAATSESIRTTDRRNVHASAGTKNGTNLELSMAEIGFETPAIVFARFHNCIAEPHSIRLITRDAGLIAETSAVHDIVDPRYRDSRHLILTKGRVRQVQSASVVIDEDVLIPFNSFSPSFGHYLLTSLPIILCFREDIQKGLLRIVVPEGFPHWVTAFLFELGLREQDLLRLPPIPHRFRSAIVSNILDGSNTRAPNSESIRWLRDLIAAAPKPESPERKIYLKRSGSGNVSSRTISNETAAMEALERRQFKAVEPATMSLLEQIGLFNQADVIVSPHGSTFANLVFCHKDAAVLDLMPDSWVGVRGDRLRDVWASRLCSLMKLRYSILLLPSRILRRHFTGNPTIEADVSLSELLECIEKYN
jgi:hypothetical protein